MQHFLPLWGTLTLAAVLSACSPQAIQQQVNDSVQVSSTTAMAGALPDRVGCKGPGVSPQISWSDPPAGTKSLALIMDDKDALYGHLHRHFNVHWLAFDMPADKRDLPEGRNSQRSRRLRHSVDGTQRAEHHFHFRFPEPQ